MILSWGHIPTPVGLVMRSCPSFLSCVALTLAYTLTERKLNYDYLILSNDKNED